MDLLGKSQEAEDELALAGSPAAEPALAAYEKQLAVLENKRQHWLRLDPSLSRALVSFQANKSRPVYRWFKYKEGFSADLIETLLTRHGITSGCVLDPFAGSGAGLFVAAARGLRAEGIELLPIGQQLIAARQLVEQGLDAGTLKLLRDWATQAPWLAQSQAAEVPSLRITAGAYSDVTQDGIGRYLAALASVPQPAQTILHFALLCVLENVSFTRKDGQYLRWDHRSARRQGVRPFNKGHIPAFAEAIQDKLLDMLADLEQEAAGDDLFAAPAIAAPAVSLHKGSCHDWLPRLADGGYSAIITSPPYCNRYDYTRTYALELALLGVDEEGLRALRQDMLSCTVENRAKDLLALHPAWAKPLGLAAAQLAR